MYPQGVCHIRKPASLATAVQYFPFFKPRTGGKRSVAQPQTIYSEFPHINGTKPTTDRLSQSAIGFCHLDCQFLHYNFNSALAAGNCLMPKHRNVQWRSLVFFIHNCPLPPFSPRPVYTDPSFLNTTSTVFSRILISNPIFQFSMYSLSSLTTSSKSVILLRPLTCHMPVIPGLMASLAWW